MWLQVASQSTDSSASTQLLTAATPGLTLYNATLFIDTPDIGKYTSAATSGEKAGLIRVPLGYSYGYGYDYYVGDPYYYP